jgi:RNA-directed DNA polymerase
MLTPNRRREAGTLLAAAFMRGTWEEEPMWRRGRAVYGHAPRWLRPVVRAVLAGYPRPPVDRPRELAAFIATVLDRRDGIALRSPPVQMPSFSPRMGPMPWPVPRIETTGELAERLELDAGQLAWLADVRGLERVVTADKLRNYRYQMLPRAGGSPRVIERPRARLKEIQRFILREILVWIPPHDAAHGFVRNRSAKTHAAIHAGRPAVLRVDVEDFFAAVTAARVYAIFRTAGYPEAVAHALTGLCTNVVPRELEIEGYRLRRRLATPHLPQGAPTSPALANLAAHRLDRRLSGLGATYSRYADDLVFSGPHRIRGLLPAIAAIALDEGLRLNARKTRFMSAGGRQVVTGIVVNVRPNIARADYDRLKALLHNARRDGPGEHDRDALLGRIAWVAQLNPARGAKLCAAFDAIDWCGH